MVDYTHLFALNLRLSHERAHLAAAKTNKERELRSVWVSGIEKEISNEFKFLGLDEPSDLEMTDEQLLAELGL